MLGGTWCLANWRLSQWRYLWQPFHRGRDRGARSNICPVARLRRWAIDRRVVDDDGPFLRLRLLLLCVCGGQRCESGEHGNGERYGSELHDDNLRCLLPDIWVLRTHTKRLDDTDLGLPPRSPRRPMKCRPAGAHLPLALAERTADETHRKMRRLDSNSPARIACRQPVFDFTAASGSLRP